MIELKNDNITVELDESTGALSAIRYPGDKTLMNWILKKPLWGTAPGFSLIRTEKSGGAFVSVFGDPSTGIRLSVERTITDGGYFEKYLIENPSEVEFFLTKDNFGILMPTSCNYLRKEKLTDKCVSHLWCADGVCWMYCARTKGEKPYLVMELTEGSVCDYSIDYDYSLTKIGADWRGAFLLHPKDCVVSPGERVSLTFRLRFSPDPPDAALSDRPGALRFTASKYSLLVNEEVYLELEYNGDPFDASISCEGERLPVRTRDGKIVSAVRFGSTGERRITASVGGHSTFIRVNVIESLSDILAKRARFIAEKQQYHSPGSRLDGAYLIWDSETGTCYCGKFDHNAGRERIGMGVTVCRALQSGFDAELMDSLKKHRAFVERELFDPLTATVFNDVGRDGTYLRFYNFPWVSVYYLEWYELTKEIRCLEYAARILLRFCGLTGGALDAQNIEAVRILEALEREGLTELREELLGAFIRHADSVVERSGQSESPEVTWVNELPNCMCCYLSQAYYLTREEKYIKAAEKFARMSEAFFAYQPDYHLNCVTVRYWDDFWFGKIGSYGDVFPHYWSALSAWSLYWYDKARGVSEHAAEIESCLSGNLCIFMPDGSAANCYLYPYRIELYTTDPLRSTSHFKPRTTYGKRFDPWANDQDWALYLASRILDFSADAEKRGILNLTWPSRLYEREPFNGK